MKDSSFLALQPLVGQGLIIIEASWSHSKHATLCRAPQDKWSARGRDLYLKTHNTHERQTSMSRTGFESASPASERQQTHALEGAATGIGYAIMTAFNW